MAHCLVQRKKIACGAQVGLYMYNVPPPRWVTKRLTLMSQPYLVEIILTFMSHTKCPTAQHPLPPAPEVTAP